MTTVKEIMESRVVSVNTATPIVEVERLMKVMKTGVVAVCDNGKFQGMITQRDLVNILATAGEPLKESAGSMMNKNCPIISPNDDILRAADVMVEKGVHVLPVVVKRGIHHQLDGLSGTPRTLSVVSKVAPGGQRGRGTDYRIVRGPQRLVEDAPHVDRRAVERDALLVFAIPADLYPGYRAV